MAVKKPVKKRDATSPNTALVLFLVFFVLLSIGLGVWGYYGYAGQKKLKESLVALMPYASMGSCRLGTISVPHQGQFSSWKGLVGSGSLMTSSKSSTQLSSSTPPAPSGSSAWSTPEASRRRTP